MSPDFKNKIIRGYRKGEMITMFKWKKFLEPNLLKGLLYILFSIGNFSLATELFMQQTNILLYFIALILLWPAFGLYQLAPQLSNISFIIVSLIEAFYIYFLACLVSLLVYRMRGNQL